MNELDYFEFVRQFNSLNENKELSEEEIFRLLEEENNLFLQDKDNE